MTSRASDVSLTPKTSLDKYSSTLKTTKKFFFKKNKYCIKIINTGGPHNSLKIRSVEVNIFSKEIKSLKNPRMSSNTKFLIYFEQSLMSEFADEST